MRPSHFLTDLRKFIDHEEDFLYFASRYDPRVFAELLASALGDVVNASTKKSQRKFWKTLDVPQMADVTATLRASTSGDRAGLKALLAGMNAVELGGLVAILTLMAEEFREVMGLDDPEAQAALDAKYDQIVGTSEPESA